MVDGVFCGLLFVEKFCMIGFVCYAFCIAVFWQGDAGFYGWSFMVLYRTRVFFKYALRRAEWRFI